MLPSGSAPLVHLVIAAQFRKERIGFRRRRVFAKVFASLDMNCPDLGMPIDCIPRDRSDNARQGAPPDPLMWLLD